MPESNLRLSADEETELIQYLTQRISSLERDNDERIQADRKSEKDYENDKSYRDDPIYKKSNLSIPLTSLVVDHFSSRSEEEITGSAPFFNNRPKGNVSPDIAMATCRFLRDKLDSDARLRDALNGTFHPIFTQRAVILKAIYKKEVDEWEDHGRIALFDKTAGEFAMHRKVDAATGDDEITYVLYGEGEWQQDIDVNPEGAQVIIWRNAIAPDVKLTDEEYRAAPGDPIFEQGKYEWAELDEPIIQQEVLCKGAKSIMVDSSKFLAPMNVESLDDADILVEKYDRTTAWVKKRWLKGKGREKWSKVKDTYEAGNASPKTNNATEHSDENETRDAEELGFDTETQLHPLHEVWLTRDVKGTGTPQRMCIFFDLKNAKLIYYEYSATLLPRATMRHPFDSVCIWAKKNRWWGLSMVEMLSQYQIFIDLHFNRWAYRNAIATNPIIKYDPEKTVEQKEFFDLEPFEIVTPTGNASMAEIFEAFVLPTSEHNTKDLIDRVVYFVQLWLGVSNLAQGDGSQMPANPTAYGQDMMLREASKISKRWSRRIIIAFQSHVKKLAMIELEMMDQKAQYAYSDGNDDIVEYLERSAVEGMDVGIELVLTKDQSQITIEANRLAEELITKYAMYDPIMKIRVRPLYKKSLMSLGYEDVEDMLPVPSAEEIEAFAMAPPVDEDGNPIEGGADANQTPKPPKAPSPASGPRG